MCSRFPTPVHTAIQSYKWCFTGRSASCAPTSEMIIYMQIKLMCSILKSTQNYKKIKKILECFRMGVILSRINFRSSVFGEFATRPGTTTTSGTLMMSAPHAPSTGTRQGHITSPYPNHHLRLPPLLPLQGGQTCSQSWADTC